MKHAAASEKSDKANYTENGIGIFQHNKMNLILIFVRIKYAVW